MIAFTRTKIGLLLLAAAISFLGTAFFLGTADTGYSFIKPPPPTPTPPPPPPPNFPPLPSSPLLHPLWRFKKFRNRLSPSVVKMDSG
jgi:hypothetical protein